MDKQQDKATLKKEHTLSKILGAILCDIAEAQDISNRYTVELAKKYYDNPLLQEFPVPNGFLRELEIDFKLATEAVGLNNENSSIEQYYRQALPGVASIIASNATKIVQQLIAGIKDKTSIPDLPDKVIASLSGKGWLQFLSAKVLDSLGDMIAQKDILSLKEVSDTEFLEPLWKSLDQSLFEHGDIKKLKINATDLKGAKDLLKKQSGDWVNVIISNLEQQKQLLLTPTLTGQINSAALQGIEALANFKLKVELRDYKWLISIRDDENGLKFNAKRLVSEKS